MYKKQLSFNLLFVVLSLFVTTSLVSCSVEDNEVDEQEQISSIADQVWAYSLEHPDGFTLNIHTMTAPTEGISVAYAATQNSHSRDQLDKVVSHSLQNSGYVGGWYDSYDGLYYFDSVRLFPEDQLEEALQFAEENGQYAVFVISTSTEISVIPQVAAVLQQPYVSTPSFYSYW
ncbi:MAG: hypothetical protein K5683_04975 [Prevotella sp.]|nr:hypothetical protein [Prevotella sp.]